MKRIDKETVNNFVDLLEKGSKEKISPLFIDLKVDHSMIVSLISRYIDSSGVNDDLFIYYSGSYSKGTHGLFSDVDVFFLDISESKYYSREFKLIDGVMFELNFISSSYLLNDDLMPLTQAKFKNTFFSYKSIKDGTSGRGGEILDEFMSRKVIFDSSRSTEYHLFSITIFIMDLFNPVDKSDYLLSATLLLNYYMGLMVWHYTGDITKSFKLLDRDPKEKNKKHPYFKRASDSFSASIVSDDPNIFINEVCSGLKEMGYSLTYGFKDTHMM